MMINFYLDSSFMTMIKLRVITFACLFFKGGQFILELVDYYGGTFLALFCAIAEIIGVFWIYGKVLIIKDRADII